MRAVFVSSTFRDMQFERDALLTRVVPRMNAFLQKYAETVHFGDLRWGVNTTELESEESSKKVLRVCLDQIDDCKPYMIVFIGERYGWIPSADLLHGAALLKGMDVSKIAPDTSVTELEIEYGALLNPDLEGRILFYFRRPFDMSEMTPEERADYASESPLHREKVESLKRQILEKYPGFVRYYDVAFDKETRTLTGLEPLMELIYSDLQRIFDLDLSYLASLPAAERALANSRAYLNKIGEGTVDRKESSVNDFDFDAFEYYYQMRYETTPSFEVITADVGMGAKTVIAQQMRTAEEEGSGVIALAYGLDEFTSSMSSIEGAIAYKLEEMMGHEHVDYRGRDYLADLLYEYTTVSELPYLHIFMVNLPRTALGLFHRIAALYPNLFGVGFHVHFRTPLADNAPLPFFLKNYVTRVAPLTKREQKKVIQSILRSKRKELSEPVIAEILAHKSSACPLYLSLLVERLLMLDSEDFKNIRALGDGMDNINKYMISIVRESGDDVADISHDLLRELCQRINPTMIPRLIAHLTLRHHLNEEGISELFGHYGWGYNALDYTLFKKTFPSLVYESADGFLFFTNDDVKEGARRLLEELKIDTGIDELIDYLKTKSEKYSRKGLPIMLAEAGRAAEFLDVILSGIDVPIASVFKGGDEGVREKYNNYEQRYTTEMAESLSREGDTLATDVIAELARRLAAGEIQYPYTVLSACFRFNTPNLSSVADTLRSARMLMTMTALFEKYSGQSEAVDVAIFLLRTIHFHAYTGFVIDPEFEAFVGECARYTQRVSERMSPIMQELQRKRLIYIEDTGADLIVSMYNYYTRLKAVDNPTKHPLYAIVSGMCTNMDNLVGARTAEYFDCLFRGDTTWVDRFGSVIAQSFWLGMGAYMKLINGDVATARTYYLAFLSLHRLKFSGGIDWRYRQKYFGLLSDTLDFLGEQEYDGLAEIYDDVFRSCYLELSENYTDVGSALALMKMHRDGARTDAIKDVMSPFYTIWTVVLSRVGEITDPDAFFTVIDYFIYFRIIFTRDEELDERFFRFSEIVTALLEHMIDTGHDDGAAHEYLYIAARKYAYAEDMSIAEVIDMLGESLADGTDIPLDEVDGIVRLAHEAHGGK